jgi:glutamate/tyrosine decarboxylase-like PLP-dependent enzyme
MKTVYDNGETGLDPENWEDFRALGHRMVEDMVDYLSHIGEGRVWTPVPDVSKKEFARTLPAEPGNIFEIYNEFKEHILPYHGGNIHPAYFSWVQGTGTAMGALTGLLTGALNSNTAMGDQSALYVDRQVVNWCKEMLGFPATAGGMLVSGGSIANITALIVARNTIISDSKTKGVYVAEGKLTAYCSSETHNCVNKGAEVIGIGSEQLRKIPVNDAYEIDTEALQRQITDDRAKGYIPFCIIGNAGTVNTGATDDLDELLRIARAEKLWLHIDGAFGALAKLVPGYQPKLKAIEDVDSVAFDLHKWMYMPYEAGCVLVKNEDAYRKAFATAVNYLTAHERGLAAGPENLSNFGLELSRGFKALKIWMSLKEHGVKKYAALIEQNIDQAFYAGGLIKQTKELELLAPVSLNIVCYRYNPEGFDDDTLNKLNKEILMRLQEAGIAAPSSTVLNGKYAIRAAITNHRTRRVHLEQMIAATVEIGNRLVKEQEARLFNFDILINNR